MNKTIEDIIRETCWIVKDASGKEYLAINHKGIIVKRAKLQVFLSSDKELKTKYSAVAIVVEKRIPTRHRNRRRKPWMVWEG